MDFRDRYIDDIGMPHPDVRLLVNSIIFMEKNVPPAFLQEEHERLNLVFFAREFINAAKKGPPEPVEYAPPTFKLFTPGEPDGEDADSKD
jgi:hypothetical protein